MAGQAGSTHRSSGVLFDLFYLTKSDYMDLGFASSRNVSQQISFKFKIDIVYEYKKFKRPRSFMEFKLCFLLD